VGLDLKIAGGLISFDLEEKDQARHSLDWEQKLQHMQDAF